MQTAPGGEHPAFDWLKYDRYDFVSMRFRKFSLEHAAAETLKTFASAMADGTVTESAINSYGYRQLGRKELPDAILVFERNVNLHPAASNVYDSLGEASAMARE